MATNWKIDLSFLHALSRSTKNIKYISVRIETFSGSNLCGTERFIFWHLFQQRLFKFSTTSNYKKIPGKIWEMTETKCSWNERKRERNWKTKNGKLAATEMFLEQFQMSLVSKECLLSQPLFQFYSLLALIILSHTGLLQTSIIIIIIILIIIKPTVRILWCCGNFSINFPNRFLKTSNGVATLQ